MHPTSEPVFVATHRVDRYVLAVGLAAALLIAYLTAGRRYLGFGVESDILLQFMPESERFLAGAPLELPYHPPVYPILLALARSLTGDWLSGGIAISIAAAAVAILVSFYWFRALAGTVVGLGAVAGVLASSSFIAHAGLASADMLFLAVFVSVCCAAALAARSGDVKWWIATGVLIGVAMLIRTNGITLLAAILLPWFGRADRLKSCAGVVAGVSAPLALWIAYAALTGSHVAPSGTHVSLAWYYFRRELLFDDAYTLLSLQYASALDVFLSDPLRIVRTYVSDFYYLAHRVLGPDFTLTSPLNLLVLPGLVYLAITSRPFLQHLAILIVPQLLLLNLTFQDQRYYLFLVPVFGACAIATFELVRRHIEGRVPRALTCAVFAAMWALAAMSAVRGAGTYWTSSDAELDAVVGAVRSAARPDSLIVARKFQIGYHSGVAQAWVPPSVQSIDDLGAYLRDARTRNALVYVGSEEVKVRPRLRELLTPQLVPPWLVVEASGTEPVPWGLFRYVPPAGSSP